MSDLLDNIWETYLISGDQTMLGQDIKNGTEVNRIEIAEVNNAIYQFPAFILWKLYLSMANEAEKFSTTLCKKLKSTPQLQRSVDKKKIYAISAENPDDILIYFQSMISIYSFSISALEAYTNLRIDSFKPKEQDYLAVEQLIKSSPYNELVLVKSDILRECSLGDKIFYILPYFLSKKNITLSLTTFEPDFKLINHVRNLLSHVKRKEVRTGQENDGKFKTSKLWNYLIPKFQRDTVTLSFQPATFATRLINNIEESCSKG